MNPKARLDALSDSLFGVAMTSLVLDVRLPETFHPHDAPELLHGLRDLISKLLPYTSRRKERLSMVLSSWPALWQPSTSFPARPKRWTAATRLP
jgi:hypothetical protein